MSVHRRVPIKATVESRMQRARTAHIVAVIDRVIRFVWVFFLDALKREGGKVRSLGLSEIGIRYGLA